MRLPKNTLMSQRDTNAVEILTITDSEDIRESVPNETTRVFL